MILSLYMQILNYAHINSNLSPLFVNHQQRGEIKQNNKDIYAIYIHEEEDAKLASLHICIT